MLAVAVAAGWLLQLLEGGLRGNRTLVLS